MELNLEIDLSDIEGSFARIANELMNEYLLKANEKRYRIAELEFYFQHREHLDTYTHGSELQKQTGRWYVHASGMDITFGKADFHGGILIRALLDLDAPETDKKQYIYGPINSLKELMKGLGAVSDAGAAFQLFLEATSLLSKEPIVAAPRVGLNEERNPEMYDKLYRFLIFPTRKHAEKGRIVAAMEKSKIE